MSLPLSVRDHHPYPKNLIPIGFIIFFTLCVALILFIIFPGRILISLTLKADQPDPVALFYLHELSKYHPEDHQFRSAYIHQQIALDRLDAAEESIKHLEKMPESQNHVAVLKYELLLARMDKLKNKKVAKDLPKNELIQSYQNLLQLQLVENEWIKLANTSLRYNQPDHALSFYLKADALRKHKDIDWYLLIAKTAMQTSAYAVAADYYLKAAEIEPNIQFKREYIKQGLLALLGGRMVEKGLKVINQLPAEVTNNTDFLFFLSQYALSANQPKLAAEFVQKAISLEERSP